MAELKYARSYLIKLCDAAIVNHKDWRNRDSAGAHMQVGVAWAMLRAGVEYEVLYEKQGVVGGLCTDEDMIWLKFTVSGFSHFEGGGMDTETVYIPTRKRLQERDGDWY